MNTLPEIVRLFASPRTWIDGEAMRQLYSAAALNGVRLAVGFPDLHAGRGTAVGAAVVTEDVIYPHLIGDDIGCGMALFKTGLLRREADLDRWAAAGFHLEHSWNEDASGILAEFGLAATDFDGALGTVGGGNHFAELQAVEKIVDPREFRRLDIGKEQILALVHSGSGGLGKVIRRRYVTEHCREGVSAGSAAGEKFLRDHDLAVHWARVNRSLIARRFLAALGAEVECLWDGCHNSISPAPGHSMGGWIHRKGAVIAGHAPVVIAGSRGSFSYLVKPTGEGETSAWSLAHGAGRLWSRSEARLRMRERFGAQQLLQTPLSGRVICENRDLLYEEAPAAYKNIETVIADLVKNGLVSVIATLRPLLTYKMRKVMR